MSPVPQLVDEAVFAAAAGSDALWKAFAQQGNAARTNGDVAGARSLYEAALAEAERVFEAARLERMPDAAALAPVLFNISCHNLAQLVLELGDAEGSLRLLERAFERLVLTAGEDIAAPFALRTSCARHLQVAAAALAEALLERGARERAEECVRRANAAIFAVVELARTPAQSKG
jgi:tetratricopeptide (TPR) repeat protein